MSTEVHVVINVCSGIVDNVRVFKDEAKATEYYRELICENKPFTGPEVAEILGPLKLDEIWRQDSTEYLYAKDTDLYFPISTHDHDVYMYSEIEVE